jgi:hypothetical protein
MPRRSPPRSADSQFRSTPIGSTENQLRKIGCRAGLGDPAHTSSAHFDEYSCSNLRARSRQLRAFVFMRLEMLPGVAPSGRFLGGGRIPAPPVQVGPIRAMPTGLENTLNRDYSGTCGTTIEDVPAASKTYIALHEMGHVLGFDHPPPGAASGLGRVHIARPDRRSLVYPTPPTTASTLCPSGSRAKAA